MPVAEFVLGKQRILELYLNVVEWGPGIYGADSACALLLRNLGPQYRPGTVGTARRDSARSAQAPARAHESLQRDSSSSACAKWVGNRQHPSVLPYMNQSRSPSSWGCHFVRPFRVRGDCECREPISNRNIFPSSAQLRRDT